MDKTCSSASACGGDSSAAKFDGDSLLLANRMSKIKRKILVLSGKGGVGKSTVAANLAVAMAMQGKKTGLLDVDLHGPSIPGIFGIKNERLLADENGNTIPFEIGENLKIVSVGLLIENAQDAVIWRGPMKYSVIKQLLKDVAWGELDCLIIDSPPGTGDEPLATAQMSGENSSAVIVTTPQDIAVTDVRRSISFCRKLSLPVTGIIENMSGFTCPHCGENTDLFSSGGGEKLAEETGVPFLGKIPIDPQIVLKSDAGYTFAANPKEHVSGNPFMEIVEKISENNQSNTKTDKEKGKMKIAIPTAGKKLCMHFGHCEEFAIIEVDGKNIVKTEYLEPPPHEPGVLPKWLSEKGADVIIAGGMGQRAQGLFSQNNIEVVVGAQGESPEEIVTAYLNGTLQTGGNVCDH